MATKKPKDSVTTRLRTEIEQLKKANADFQLDLNSAGELNRQKLQELNGDVNRLQKENERLHADLLRESQEVGMWKQRHEQVVGLSGRKDDKIKSLKNALHALGEAFPSH